MINRVGMSAVIACLSASVLADMVTERWGEGPCRHAGKAASAAADGGWVIKYDFSDLPPHAKVIRARLLPYIHPSGSPLEEPLLAQALSGPAPEKAAPRLAGQPAELLGPRFVTLNVTDIVRQWTAGKLPNNGLLVKGKIDLARTFLEISYEGAVKDPPPPVTGLKAVCKSGQVFLTWREVNTPFAGKDVVPWQELKAEKERIGAGKGPIVTYRVYRHHRPITAASIAEAELVDEVGQHSAFDEREIKTEWKGEGVKNVRVAEAPVPRLFVEEKTELPIGTGVWVGSCRQEGDFYYAVVSASDGVENAAALDAGNTAGPLQEKVAFPEPIYVREQKFQYDRDRKQECFIWWVDYPLNNVPTFIHISFAVPLKPSPEKPPLVVGNWWFSSGWNIAAQGPCSYAIQFNMDHNLMDTRGWHEGCGTYKAVSQGVVRCWFINQVRAILPWIKTKYGIDEDRIHAVSAGWAWHYGDIFAVDWDGITMNLRVSPAGDIIPVRFWGDPRKPYPSEWGMSAWDWWDAGQWIQRHPAVELPYITCSPHLHSGDFGVLDKPQLYRALLDTKRAFAGNWHEGGQGHRDITFLYEVRKSDSLPAFGNCSLDDNPGIGLGGDEGGEMNSWLAFEPRTQVDQPGRWEYTVYLLGGGKASQSAPLDSCTADVTPRRCRNFKAKPGEKFLWTNTSLADNKEIQKGAAAADPLGLVTCENVVITKGKNRLVIQKAD